LRRERKIGKVVVLTDGAKPNHAKRLSLPGGSTVRYSLSSKAPRSRGRCTICRNIDKDIDEEYETLRE
jgi:hypothetical protein